MIALGERFDDGALGLEGAPEVQDVTFEDGNFQDHFFFFAGKYLHFDEVELLCNVIKLGKAGIKENLEDMVKEFAWAVLQVETAFALAFLE